MATTARLSYLWNCIGCTPAQMLAFVSAVTLDLSVLDVFGVTVSSDDGGVIEGSVVVRTITINLTQPPTVSVNNPPTQLVGSCPQVYNWTGSIVSSSPRDALVMHKSGNPDCCTPDSTTVGDGAHTVTVTYLDETGAGPFTEVVTLQGQTRVPMVLTNKSKIVKVVNTTTGSSGLSVGQITVFADPIPLPNCPCPDNAPGRIVAYVPEGLQYGPAFRPGPAPQCEPVVAPVPPDQAADFQSLFSGQFALAFPTAPPLATAVLLT